MRGLAESPLGMRLFLAFMAGGLVTSVIDNMTVFWVVVMVVWGALHIVSPGHCPHCRKGVRFLADTCHHCGKSVREA